MYKPRSCNFCDKPLTPILLGKQRFPVWVHRGSHLEKCKAMKLKRNMMRELYLVIQKIGKNRPLIMNRKDDGEVTIFGETRLRKTSEGVNTETSWHRKTCSSARMSHMRLVPAASRIGAAAAQPLLQIPRRDKSGEGHLPDVEARRRLVEAASTQHHGLTVIIWLLERILPSTFLTQTSTQ